MHIRNRYKQGYNFDVLMKANPSLAPFVKTHYSKLSIDFSNSAAVIELNKAMLFGDYQLSYWQIPDGYLCPPIPGRVDYIHHLADLLFNTNGNKKPKAKSVNALDIGTGSSLIYPILGNREYQWRFVGADIDPISIENSQRIITNNNLTNIECRLQPQDIQCFNGIIKENERFDITLCNPPFNASSGEAEQANKQKWHNLKQPKSARKSQAENRNFGGQQAELYCDGGELKFVRRMINESKHYQQQVLWFSCLISKKENIRPLKLAMKKAGALKTKTVTMQQGQKVSRFIAWTFKNPEQLSNWCHERFY